MIKKFDDCARVSTAIYAALRVDSFHNFLFALGISPKQAADCLGVTARTVKAYALKNCAPPAAIISLYALAGFLLADGFDGWRVVDTVLLPPGVDQGANSAEIRNMTFLKGVYARVMDENQALADANAYLKRLFNAEQMPLYASHAPVQFDQVQHKGDCTYITTGGQHFTYRIK